MPAFIQKLVAYFSAWRQAIYSPSRSVRPKPNTAASAASKDSQAVWPDLLQQEIRAQRKFSMAEAIGREGGSFMKGESTIPRPLRATTEINQFITAHLSDPASALSTTLQAWACDDIRVSRQLDTPLRALEQIMASLLAEPTTFCEFARQVAIAQSKLTGDRPYFQLPNQPPHPEASYTHATISAELKNLLADLQQHFLSSASPDSLH